MKKIKTEKDGRREEKIEQVLSRNVEDVIDREHLRAALLSGKKLRVKLGIDPTSPDLHLGHAVVLRKLREFQDLGCVAVLIVGDFTGQIGDPTGRAEARKPLTADAVKKNMEHYFAQAKKILEPRKMEVAYNSSWFEKEGVMGLTRLAAKATFQQVIKRADFKQRIDAEQDITFLELLYPLLQGYDSVKVKADVELGGSDQMFNVLMGRRIQRQFDMPEQDIMTSPLLEGLDGVKKMSKSLGNYIGLDDEPNDMFGKVMSVPDALVNKYFMLCTDVSVGEVKKLTEELEPKELKERLGFEIVTQYHGAVAAKRAQEHFEKVFSRHEMPDDLPELVVAMRKLSALDLAMVTGELKSRSEARRLIEQGGFELDEKIIKNPQEEISLYGGETLRIGKRRFFKVKLGK
jgi:tyrosyl-tRNA synthetase